MPVLREVITRFKFETDDSSERDVDRRVSGMKRGISGLGKMLGITLGMAGAKALFTMGQSAARAEFSLRNLAGVQFDPLRARMDRIRAELEQIRTGAGDVFRQRDFDEAAAGYVRVFGTGRRELELFDKIFRSAAQQSVVTGQNIQEIVQNLTSALQSGDFSALLDFPDIDQSFIRRMEDINELFNLGEIGGQAAFRQRAGALAQALDSVAQRQARTLANVPAQLLEATRSAQTFQDVMDKMVQALTEKLVPAIETLNELLTRINAFMSRFGGSDEEKFESPFRRRMSGTPIQGGLMPVSTPGGAHPIGQMTGGGDSVIINNTYHISGASDPRAIAEEIDKAQRKTFQDARRSVIPSEAV